MNQFEFMNRVNKAIALIAFKNELNVKEYAVTPHKISVTFIGSGIPTYSCEFDNIEKLESIASMGRII